MPAIDGVPEIYADVVQIATGNAGIFFGFRAVSPFNAEESLLQDPGAEPPSPLKAIVRMSQEDAKIFAIVLRHALKQFEVDHGVIDIPEEFYQSANAGNDAW